MTPRPGTRRKQGGASIADVARLAGVSAQTVSRVSTGTVKVRDSTRARVLSAMNQLGYAPNNVARALRNGTFSTIGLMAQRFERTGEAMITEAVIEAAEAEGYVVTIVNVRDSAPSDWDSAAVRLSGQAIDGLVIIRADQASPENLRLPHGLPVAVSDSRLVGYYAGVGANQVQGAELAVEHLLDLGHPTVHHIAGPSDSAPAQVRAGTWQRALELRGIKPPERWVGDWTARSGYQLGLTIAQQSDVTAVFCGNDEMAMGLMRALIENGRRVPHDVSIVGFDGVSMSEYVVPPLTTVRQDFHAIGRELVRLVLHQIHTGEASSNRVLIPTELVVRGTTSAWQSH